MAEDIAGGIFWAAWIALIIAVQVSAFRIVRRRAAERRWGRGKVVAMILAWLFVGVFFAAAFARDERRERDRKPSWYPELDDDIDEPGVEPRRRKGGPTASGVREPRRPRPPSDGAAQRRT